MQSKCTRVELIISKHDYLITLTYIARTSYQLINSMIPSPSPENLEQNIDLENAIFIIYTVDKGRVRHYDMSIVCDL